MSSSNEMHPYSRTTPGCDLSAQQLDCVLTFLYHTCSHGVLGGVIGCPFALRLPGILANGDHLFSLFDGHLGLDLLSCLLRAEGEQTLSNDAIYVYQHKVRFVLGLFPQR